MSKFDHESGQVLETGGAKIYFEETGVSDAPVLLFLHGGFGNIEDFNPILENIEKDFRIIGVDSRGQGKSTLGEGKLTYERIQKDIEAILAHLEIEKLNIVGFSDGGIVAYRLASFSNLKIEKLITIGSRWNVENVEATRQLFSQITGESWRKKFPETFDAYTRLNPEQDFNFLAENIVAMWLDKNESGYPNEKFADFSGESLIVRGDDDHLVPLEAFIELKTLMKKAHFFNIPFASHVAYLDQKEVFMTVLNEFLRKF